MTVESLKKVEDEYKILPTQMHLIFDASKSLGDEIKGEKYNEIPHYVFLLKNMSNVPIRDINFLHVKVNLHLNIKSLSFKKEYNEMFLTSASLYRNCILPNNTIGLFLRFDNMRLNSHIKFAVNNVDGELALSCTSIYGVVSYINIHFNISRLTDVVYLGEDLKVRFEKDIHLEE